MLAVLRRASYARLFSAQIASLLGTGLMTLALSLLAFDLAGDQAGAVVGTALTIKITAYVLLSPVLTALVAGLPPKAVLVGSDLLRAAMALSLPLVTEVWQVYVLILGLQCASAVFTPSFQALIPAVLPEERDYTRALSLSRLAYDLENIASPALAAALLTVTTFRGLFLGTGLGFLLSAGLVVMTSLPVIERTRNAGFWERTTLGTRLFLARPRLRAVLGLNLVASAPTALVLVNSVVYTRELLHRDSGALAALLACFGAGSITASLLLPRALDRFGPARVMLSGAVLVTALLAAVTLMTTTAPAPLLWPALLGAWTLLGASDAAIGVPTSRVIAAESAPETRPQLFAAQFSLSHACYLLAYPLAGWIGAKAGLGWAAAALTALAALGLGLALTSWARDSHRPVDSAPAE